MPLPKTLTLASWKKEGLPLRGMKDKIKQKKTGISGALRDLEKADKELFQDFLSPDKSKAVNSALKNLKSCISGLKAKDNKKLMAHCGKMETAAKKYVEAYSAEKSKLTRDNISSYPGALKSLQVQAKAEFSPENLQFYALAVKANRYQLMRKVYLKFKGNINIPNANTLNDIFDEDIEKKAMQEWKTAIIATVKNMNDTLQRIKGKCGLKY
jgi:hypothetical protein